jgi:hypothetical protein
MWTTINPTNMQKIMVKYFESMKRSDGDPDGSMVVDQCVVHHGRDHTTASESSINSN